MNEDSDNCLDKCTRPHHLHWDDQEMGTAIPFMQGKAVSPVGYIAFIQICAFQFHLPRVTKPSFVYIVYADVPSSSSSSYLLEWEFCTQGTSTFQSLAASGWLWVSATWQAYRCTAPWALTQRAQTSPYPSEPPLGRVPRCSSHCLASAWVQKYSPSLPACRQSW